ncbi:hypothetical protein ECP03047775_5091, partial [Escherichia coli P0304777.5]
MHNVPYNQSGSKENHKKPEVFFCIITTTFNL